MAVGVYAGAFAISLLGLSFSATLPVPALRLGGLYLALTCFSLAVAASRVLKHEWVEPWIGGGQGLSLPKPKGPSRHTLNSDRYM